MVERSQVQVTIEWAKVTHNNRVKRISKPAQDMLGFVAQVRSHFKELAEVGYLYDAKGAKVVEAVPTAKFVLRWQSQSTTDASILDQSINSVEVTDQDQFLEIFCTHAIVDHNSGRLSTPRFTVFIIEAENQNRPAGVEAASGEQMALSMSPIAKLQPIVSEEDSSKQEEQVAVLADDDKSAVQSKPAAPVDLSQAIQPGVIEEIKDPKVKASEILHSVFGEGAEDAVSMEGGLSSEGDAISQGNEQLAESIVEEAYIVGEDSDNDGQRQDQSSIVLISEQESVDLKQEQEQEPCADQPVAQDQSQDKHVDAIRLEQEQQHEIVSSKDGDLENSKANVLSDKLDEVCKNLDDEEQSKKLEMLMPVDFDRLSSINLLSEKNQSEADISIQPKEMPIVLVEPPQQEEEVLLAAESNKPDDVANVESSSEGSSDSEIDMLDALQNSQELQAHLRQHIRKEISTLGPLIFNKIKHEFKLEEKIPQAEQAHDEAHLDEELRESWRLGEAEEKMVQQFKDNSDKEESLRGSARAVINEQLFDAIGQGMQGGWKMEHVHKKSNDNFQDAIEAPDKSVEEKKIPVLNRSAEPIVVEYDPKNDASLELDKSNFLVEDEGNLVDVYMKATMKHVPVAQPQVEEQKKGIFMSFVDDIKRVGAEVFSDKKTRADMKNMVSLANGQDHAEVYTEVTREEGKKAYCNIVWSLRNTSPRFNWTSGMQLIPVHSSPTLRIHYESAICELEHGASGDMKLRVRIPEEFTANHLILMCKLKQGKRLVGPILILYAKIIKRQASNAEVSSFAVENMQVDERSGNSLERQYSMIAQGLDVYTEQQLLNMGSMLNDEGYGTFDRCMLVLRVLRGHIDKARVVLSQICFSEDANGGAKR